MLNFDVRGNLTPYQAIPSKIKEFKKYLVDEIDSDSRADNYKKYIKYSNDLKALLGKAEMKQWVNGSFVTKKRNPKDIDLITFIDSATIQKLGDKLGEFIGTRSNESYGVDAYIIEVYPPNSKNAFRTEFDTVEWLYLFSHTKKNRRGQVFEKGFLEIIY